MLVLSSPSMTGTFLHRVQRMYPNYGSSVGITICKWLFQAFHDVQAVSTFDYILPLMPELFRFEEINDNEELANRAQLVLVRMCGVTPPSKLVNPLLDGMFHAIRNASVRPSYNERVCISDRAIFSLGKSG